MSINISNVVKIKHLALLLTLWSIRSTVVYMLNIEREFGVLLRQRRGAAGLNQIELADAAGVSRSSIISWEQGASTPSIVSLYKLAKALEIEPYQLLPKEESIMVDTSLDSVSEDVFESILDDIRGE